MQVLITGGTGFVGARLVEMLVERGAQEVRVLDVVPPPETAGCCANMEAVASPSAV